MSSAQIFFSLQPSGDGVELTPSARNEARATWKCPGGQHVKPNVGSIDAHIQQRCIRETPLVSTGEDLRLSLRSFLSQFGNDIVARDLYIGRVFGPDGEEISEWCTYRARKRVIIRGNEDAGYRRCEACGRVLYSAPSKLRFLYPTPPSGVDVFESDLGGMVLTESIFDQLTIPNQADLYIDRLQVIEPPPDGLGLLE